MNKNYVVYNVKLTPVSPIFIGSGEKLLDYIVLNNKCYVINEDAAISKLYEQDSEIINKIMSMVLDNQNNARKSVLVKYLKEKGYAKNESFLSDVAQYIIPANINTTNEVAQFVKNVFGEVYIPGSSIKGSIRSAIVRSILNEENIKLIQVEYQKNKKGPNDSSAGNIHQGINIVNARIQVLRFPEGQKAESAHKDIMKAIIVSDTNTRKAEDVLQLGDTRVYHKNKKNDMMPTIQECVKPKVSFNFTIKINKEIFKFLSNTDIKNKLENLEDTLNKYFAKLWDDETALMIGSSAPQRTPLDATETEKKYIQKNFPMDKYGNDIAKRTVAIKAYLNQSQNTGSVSAWLPDNKDLRDFYTQNTPNFKIGGGSGIFAMAPLTIKKPEESRTKKLDYKNQSAPVAPLGWCKLEFTEKKEGSR